MKNSGTFKRGHVMSEATRAKISAAQKGHHHSKETKAKISAIHKGKSMRGKGWTHSEETRKKIGDGHRGAKCHWWKGGVSATRDRNKHMGRRYVNWRTKVFKRDRWTCQMCGSTSGNKEAHHVRSWCNFPALRYVVKNGITLCKKPCHIQANKQQKIEESKML